MARVSRVKKTETPVAVSERIYHAALYVRLSVLDSGKKDSDTAQTQESMLRRFIKGKPHFALYSVYIDNGETGVNFKRSEFERLMGDVKAGHVDCIIVKDLSRFGRNYIEAGEYLEKVFPFLGVRFIAINDEYDSLDPTASASLSLHLKNLVNDVYARDISAKISPVLRGKQERGEFIGAWAAYGYLKSPENKHKLVIDPETAPVVQEIYAWRKDGLSYAKITRRLTEHGVPSPSQYRYQKKLVKQERFALVPWKIATVKRILECEVYLGHMVQGRKRESLFQGQKQAYLPKEEWIIVRDTHEAIVDQQTFDEVQQLNEQKNREYRAKLERFSEIENTENLLKSLVVCGDCGTKLTRYKTIHENKKKTPRFHVCYTYICPVHAADPTACTFLRISETDLIEAVYAAIQSRIAMAGDMGKLLKNIVRKSPVQEQREQLEQQIRQTQERLKKTIHHRESLYDDYADRLMSEHDYIYAQTRYKEQEAALNQQLAELNQTLAGLHEERDEDNPWLNRFIAFGEQPKLTREMALTLIDKVVIYGETAIHIDFRFEEKYQSLKDLLPMGMEAAHA